MATARPLCVLWNTNAPYWCCTSLDCVVALRKAAQYWVSVPFQRQENYLSAAEFCYGFVSIKHIFAEKELLSGFLSPRCILQVLFAFPASQLPRELPSTKNSCSDNLLLNIFFKPLSIFERKSIQIFLKNDVEKSSKTVTNSCLYK